MSYWQWAALTGLAIFMAFVVVAGLSQRNRALTSENLIRAAKKGDLNLLAYFLRDGLHYRSDGEVGYRALNQLVFEGNEHGVRMLLGSGIVPDFRAQHESAMLAVHQDRPGILQILLENYAVPESVPWPHLMAEAAKHEDRGCLNVLCNYGIGHDAGKRQQRRDEALYFAVARGYDYDPVYRLLDAGADIRKCMETLNWNLVGSKAVRQHFQGRVSTNA